MSSGPSFAQDQNPATGMAQPAQVKTYSVVSPSVWSSKRKEIHQDGKPILWITTKNKMFSAPQLNLQVDGATGPIVAATKLSKMSGDSYVFLGSDPDATDKSQWIFVQREGFTSKAYQFPVNGQPFWWRRTHRSELGASTFGSRDFKLVDAEGKVLAVFLYTLSVLGKMHRYAEVHFHVELGRDLELAALAAMLGVQEHLTRSRRSGAGGGAGA